MRSLLQPLGALFLAAICATALMGGAIEPMPKADAVAPPAASGPAAIPAEESLALPPNTKPGTKGIQPAATPKPPPPAADKAAAQATKPPPVAVDPAAAPADKATAPPAKKEVAKDAKETLPWANAPKKPAPAKAAASPCTGLFEAACREQTSCAWLADMALDDGGSVAAHCVARAAKAAKKEKPKPAPQAAAAPDAAAKPAAKVDAIPGIEPQETAKAPASERPSAAVAPPGAKPPPAEEVTVTFPQAAAPIVVAPAAGDSAVPPASAQKSAVPPPPPQQ